MQTFYDECSDNDECSDFPALECCRSMIRQMAEMEELEELVEMAKRAKERERKSKLTAPSRA